MGDLEVVLICRSEDKINNDALTKLNYYSITPTKLFESDNPSQNNIQFICKKTIELEDVSEISSIGKELEKLGIAIEDRKFSRKKSKWFQYVIPVLISFFITFFTVYHTSSILPHCNPNIDERCDITYHQVSNALFPAIINGLFILSAKYFRKLDFL